MKPKTKIVCTIGPASGPATIIEQLIKAGMSVARLNLSFGTHREHAEHIRIIREQSKRLGIDTAILLDLPGLKYRVGKLNGQALLSKGSYVVLTTRQIKGNSALIPVHPETLGQDIKVGDNLLLDDGSIKLRAIQVQGTDIKCLVTVGGVLIEGRGLTIPGRRMSGPFITDALRRHIAFAIEQKTDFIALSFISEAADVKGVKDILRIRHSDIPVIAKIERREAVADFDSILAASDGIMVARGDLGLDIPLERVPLVQKEVIRKCNQAAKPVITATQMLESMVTSAMPTRAEVTDVANAIFDGTDATMLSGETAIGQYPVQAVKMMARIARETEKRLPFETIVDGRSDWVQPETDELISYSACLAADNLRAKAIVAFTTSGSTAARVSRYRPSTPILAITPNAAVASRLLLRWGIHPLLTDRPTSVEELFVTAVSYAKALVLARSGDLIVITGGIPMGVTGGTNLLKIEKVS